MPKESLPGLWIPRVSVTQSVTPPPVKMSRSGVTGHTASESASRPDSLLPTADEARRWAEKACAVTRRRLVTAMSSAPWCRVLCLFFELSSCWHLFVKATVGQQHFKLRLTAPRQMSLQGRILKAEIVHFRLHVSGTAAPRTRAPGAGPSHWPKKLR